MVELSKAEPRLQYFDVTKFIDRLNHSLHAREEELRLGPFIHKVPRKRLIPRLLDDDHRATSSGKYELFQVHEYPFLHPFNPQGKIGYIFVEQGDIDPESSYGGTYEVLKFRLRDSLILNNDRVVPDCCVKILREVEEGGTEVIRTDHASGFLFSRKSDLTEVLPAEMFLRSR